MKRDEKATEIIDLLTELMNGNRLGALNIYTDVILPLKEEIEALRKSNDDERPWRL